MTQQKQQKTPVVYRQFKDGEIIALLGKIGDPDSTNPGMILSYMHMGQHSKADPGIVRITAPTDINSNERCKRLHQELLSRDYDLVIRQKLRRF